MATYETMRRAIEAEEAKAAAAEKERVGQRYIYNQEHIEVDFGYVIQVKPKGLRGRPRGSKLGEPWKEAGVSKATWYRRKSK